MVRRLATNHSVLLLMWITIWIQEFSIGIFNIYDFSHRCITVLNERIEILGVKTYSDPSYIFPGGQNPLTPRIYSIAAVLPGTEDSAVFVVI